MRPGLPAGQNPSNLNFTPKMFLLRFPTSLLPAWIRTFSSALPHQIVLFGHLSLASQTQQSLWIITKFTTTSTTFFHPWSVSVLLLWSTSSISWQQSEAWSCWWAIPQVQTYLKVWRRVQGKVNFILLEIPTAKAKWPFTTLSLVVAQ